MRDVIQKVLEAEAEASRLIAAAREEADSIAAAARREAQALTERVQREARVEAESILQAALQAVQEERARRLEQAQAQIDVDTQLDEPARRQAVDATVRCVCGLGGD